MIRITQADILTAKAVGDNDRVTPQDAVDTPPALLSHASLTAEASAATLRITDAADQPVHQRPTFDRTNDRLVVVVGQRVRLKVQTDPPHPMSEVNWSVTGEAVHASTVQTLEKGTAVPLTPDHLRGDLIDFHWIKGGTTTVTVSATVGGYHREASLTCEVLAPVVKDFYVTTTTVNLFLDGTYRPGNWMVLSNPAPRDRLMTPRRGCERHAEVVAPRWPSSGDPTLGDGEFAFIQLVSGLTAYKLGTNPGTYEVQTTWNLNEESDQNEFILDAGGEKKDQLLLGDGTSVKVKANGLTVFGSNRLNTDSPGIRLGSDWIYAMLFDEFKLYLVYRSTEQNSIWITLRELAWSFRGTIHRPDVASVWQQPADVNVEPPPETSKPGTVSSTLPTWQRATNGQLEEVEVEASAFDDELKPKLNDLAQSWNR